MRTACGLDGGSTVSRRSGSGTGWQGGQPLGTTDSGVRKPIGENCRRVPAGPRPVEKGTTMGLVLWIIAAILVIWGIVSLIRGQLLMGAVLIVVGLLVGPGGVSIFT
jgi:hypothetical protein